MNELKTQVLTCFSCRLVARVGPRHWRHLSKNIPLFLCPLLDFAESHEQKEHILEQHYLREGEAVGHMEATASGRCGITFYLYVVKFGAQSMSVELWMKYQFCVWLRG